MKKFIIHLILDKGGTPCLAAFKKGCFYLRGVSHLAAKMFRNYLKNFLVPKGY